ncbi:MAG: PD-(D/E)XK nuclease family protein [Bifidobacteriaceae bacterium]|jgi:putative RecB family exonuclease|nr:PD-(D/E)XK nuclease family protein [Bifidobacteriaceae bacterium]
MYKARPTLSPTAAKSFEKCPLSFRLNKIDKIKFPSSPEAAKGILVHKILQDVFNQFADKRNLDYALSIIESSWNKLAADDKKLAQEKQSGLSDLKIDNSFFEDAKELLESYFKMEDPSKIYSQSQEQWIRFNTDDVCFLGQIDRVDKSPDGQIRIVDYKTGKSPNPRFLDEVIFQLRFYAYLWEKNYKQPPALLTLYYLKDGKAVESSVSKNDIAALEKEITDIWNKVKICATENNWEARQNPLCDWCAYKDEYCPIFGGTPPKINPASVQTAIGVKPKSEAAEPKLENE